MGMRKFIRKKCVQAGYRITVSCYDMLLWDSGYCDTNKMQAVYSGADLPSGAIIKWCLQLTDNVGDTTDFVESYFKTACFDELHGEWIEPSFDTGNSVVNFKKDITLKELPQRAVLYYCGLGLSKQYINGKELDNYSCVPLSCFTPQPQHSAFGCFGTNHIKWLPTSNVGNHFPFVISWGFQASLQCCIRVLLKFCIMYAPELCLCR